MNILQTLKKSQFALPKQSYEDTFPVFLDKCYCEFLEALNQLDEGTIVDKLQPHRQTLEQFCNNLLKSLNTYFAGFPAKAYFEFEEAINLIHDFLFPKVPGKLPFNEREPYYRARVGSNRQFERHEMFHIPFELREFVTTQRFSVPGLPCLYLSNSTYACWEELKRPHVDKMQVSRFKLEDMSFNFLNISLTPNFMCLMFESFMTQDYLDFTKQNEQQALDSMNSLTLYAIMTWPLIAACSIKVKKHDAPFKPEYIFPQFLLQWVTHNKNVDGIKYSSIEANANYSLDFGELANYAIPVKEIQSSGYCQKLRNAFSLTRPVSWEILSLTNPSIIQHDQGKFEKVLFNLSLDTLSSTMELIKGKPTKYYLTTFGKLEIETADMDFQKL